MLTWLKKLSNFFKQKYQRLFLKEEEAPLQKEQITTINSSNKNTIIMAKPKIAGHDRGGPDANEAIAEISQNRTLFTGVQLTKNPEISPRIVKGKTNINQVFEEYQPSVEVQFQNEEGAPVDEKLNFKNLGDFVPKGIEAQSPFLQDLRSQEKDYEQFIKQLKNNSILQKVMANPEAKAAYLATLQALIEEIGE